MKISDIRIGMRLRIVGRKGGCPSGCRCIDCDGFKTGIVVTKIKTDNTDNRTIAGESIDTPDENNCVFCADDLEMFEITDWKKELQ